jgi:hypothetical protein
MSTAQVLPKGGTSRFNLSTQFFDIVISISQVQDRKTQHTPKLELWEANGVDSFPADNSFGVSTATPSVGLSATSSVVGEFGTYLVFSFWFNYGMA